MLSSAGIASTPVEAVSSRTVSTSRAAGNVRQNLCEALVPAFRGNAHAFGKIAPAVPDRQNRRMSRCQTIGHDCPMVADRRGLSARVTPVNGRTKTSHLWVPQNRPSEDVVKEVVTVFGTGSEPPRLPEGACGRF